MTDIDNGQDVLDVRDIIARVEELEGARDDYNASDDGQNIEAPTWAEVNEDDADELATLTALLAKLKGYGGDEEWRGDWYPVTLIRHDYFETAMDELLEDIGDLPRDLPSYLTITVDYDALKQDYSTVDYDGVEYLYR